MNKNTRSSHGSAHAFDEETLLALQRGAAPSNQSSRRSSQATAARRASLPVAPVSPPDSSPSMPRQGAGPSMPLFAPSPTAPPVAAPTDPLSPVGPQTLVRTSHLSWSGGYGSTMTRAGTGMEPVLEDPDTDEYVETHALQLPSPPGSPDQTDPRWTKHRPSHAGHPFASNTPPPRLRSSMGPGVAALPLTAAFQTSVLRSGSTSSTSGAGTSSQTQRYPPITTSPPPRTRSRPSSVSVSMVNASGTSVSRLRPTPEANVMAHPTEAFRRMSTSDVRHSSSSLREDDHIGRAYLRSSNALQVPEIRNGSMGPSRNRHATVYHPPQPHSAAPTPPHNPLSPFSGDSTHMTPTPSSSTPRPSVSTSHHQRLSGMGAPPVSWKSLASGSRSSWSSQQTHLRDQTRSRPSSSRSTASSYRKLPPLDDSRSPSAGLEDSSDDEHEGHNERRGKR